MKMTRQSGLSLVELMVALLIGSFLVLGLVQVFTANKQGFQIQEATSRIQENGRMAIEMLSRGVREVGFMGCANVLAGTQVSNNVDASQYSNAWVKEALNFNGADALEVFNNLTTTNGTNLKDFGLVVGTGSGQIVAGTDAIIMKGAEPCDGGKVISYNATSAQFKIADAASCGLNQRDIVIVANCNGADIFAITNNPNPPGGGGNKDTLTHAANLNTSSKLTGSYDKESYIYRYKTEVYYIAYNDQGEPALYLRRLVSAADTATPFETLELASGVEDLQLVLGEDTDGDFVANRYVAAGTAGLSMDNVVAMKISLLTRSSTGALQSGTQTYYFNGSTVTATDNRLRAPFQATVALRNRVR